MRRSVAIVISCSALLAASALPAMASELSSQDVARGFEVTMTKAEARQLGVPGRVFGTFAVAQSDTGTPDAPWLCDLSGTDEVEGKGASSIVSREYISLDGQTVADANQAIHVYGNAKQAKAAYDDIVKKIKQCEGTQNPAADAETQEAGGMTTQLTNGTKKAADGDSFLWVRSQTVIGGESLFASHEYSTVRHFGRYLQILQIESQGASAPDLTAKQIRTADKMTDVLGDRWRSMFG